MSSEVGKLIRDARVSKGLTMEEVIKRMAVKTSMPTMSRLENGKSTIKEFAWFASLCNVLDIPFSEAVDCISKIRRKRK